MTHHTQRRAVTNGATIPASEVAHAITHAPFTYDEGASQVFTADGRTTYTEGNQPSEGEWGIDEDGRFWSFWPPSYRATYDVTWVADDEGRAVGIHFTDTQGRPSFTGRYA